MTSLIEGSVNVTKDDRSITLRPSQMAYLQNGSLRIQEIEDYNIYRWREGLMCFKDKTFAEIMEKIENKEVLNYRCSGKFRYSDGISYALRVLQKDVKFKFHRDENSDIIHIK